MESYRVAKLMPVEDIARITVSEQVLIDCEQAFLEDIGELTVDRKNTCAEYVQHLWREQRDEFWSELKKTMTPNLVLANLMEKFVRSWLGQQYMHHQNGHEAEANEVRKAIARRLLLER